MSDPNAPESGETHEVGAKRSLDPTFKRNLSIVVGLAVVMMALIGYFVMRVFSSSGPMQQASSIPVREDGGRPTNGNVTPAMKSMLQQQQAKNAQQAIATGASYVPSEINLGKPIPIASAPERHYGANPAPQAAMPQTQVAPQQEAIGQAEMEGLRRQLPLILQAGQAEAGMVEIHDERPVAAASASAGSAKPPAAGASAPEKQLVGAWRIFSATLTSPIDTSKTSYISAVVNGGPLNGAFLVGTSKLKGDSVELVFKNMRLKNTAYGIDAIGLDEATASNAIDGNVDHHLLSKYVFPVALAAVGGYAAAMANPGSTLVGIGVGGTAIATPPSTTQQARDAGINAAVGIAQQRVQTLASQPNTFTLGAGTTIGVMFRAPVFAH